MNDRTSTRTNTVSTTANATWLLALVYFVGQWLIALRAGVATAWLVTGILATCGAAAAVFCLLPRQARGRRGVWIPAAFGLILNAIALVTCLQNVFSKSA